MNHPPPPLFNWITSPLPDLNHSPVPAHMNQSPNLNNSPTPEPTLTPIGLVLATLTQSVGSGGGVVLGLGGLVQVGRIFHARGGWLRWGVQVEWFFLVWEGLGGDWGRSGVSGGQRGWGGVWWGDDFLGGGITAGIGWGCQVKGIESSGGVISGGRWRVVQVRGRVIQVGVQVGVLVFWSYFFFKITPHMIYFAHDELLNRTKCMPQCNLEQFLIRINSPLTR